jgi:hypothetical protein
LSSIKSVISIESSDSANSVESLSRPISQMQLSRRLSIESLEFARLCSMSRHRAPKGHNFGSDHSRRAITITIRPRLNQFPQPYAAEPCVEFTIIFISRRFEDRIRAFRAHVGDICARANAWRTRKLRSRHLHA